MISCASHVSDRQGKGKERRKRKIDKKARKEGKGRADWTIRFDISILPSKSGEKEGKKKKTDEDKEAATYWIIVVEK